MNLHLKKIVLLMGVSTACSIGYAPKMFALPSMNSEIAQQVRKVTGTIVDPVGEPIIGANVLVKGTTNGAISDFDGKFTLNIEDGQII